MEDDCESSVPLVVDSPEVAEVLRRVENVQMLRHFMSGEGCTVSAFAERMNWSPLRAYRQVKAFERLGLLQVLRSEKRAGRAIQHYVCPRRRYFLPAALVSVEEYLQESFQPHEGQIKHELALAARAGESGSVVTMTTPEALQDVMTLQRKAGVTARHHDANSAPSPMTATSLSTSGTEAPQVRAGGRSARPSGGRGQGGRPQGGGQGRPQGNRNRNRRRGQAPSRTNA